MRPSTFLVVAGIIAIVAVVALYFNDRRMQASDVADIRQLRLKLDSTRIRLTQVTAAAESVQLLAEVQSREFFLSRREFHAPVREEQIREWWQATGPGTLGVVIGSVMLAAGILTRRSGMATRRPQSRGSEPPPPN